MMIWDWRILGLMSVMLGQILPALYLASQNHVLSINSNCLSPNCCTSRLLDAVRVNCTITWSHLSPGPHLFGNVSVWGPCRGHLLHCACLHRRRLPMHTASSSSSVTISWIFSCKTWSTPDKKLQIQRNALWSQLGKDWSPTWVISALYTSKFLPGFWG